MFLSELVYSLDRIKGIGPAAMKDLSNLGVTTIASLLKHYPLRWEDRLNIHPLAQGVQSGFVNSHCEVVAHEYIGHGSKKTLKVIVRDHTAFAALVCFGRNFLETKLQPGTKIYLTGQFSYKYNELQSSSFEFELYEENTKPLHFGFFLPVYSLSGNLSQKLLNKSIQQALKDYGFSIEDELPLYLKKKYGLMDKKEAIKNIHFPRDNHTLQLARKTLIYEELFHLQTVTGRKALKSHKSRKKPRELSHSLFIKAKESLPFELTRDQVKVIDEVFQDLSSDKRMSRLIQGDVGSGKTLVAFLSALPIIEGGQQCAMMAPTELLARQHADKAFELLNPLGVTTAFITGNLKSEKRKNLLEQLKKGHIDLIIGTHALFTQDVEYKDLGLVIVDEQHRFGVNQRLSLIEKGKNPDLLLMTATPIPRTLCLTAFGDLDVSMIKTMPLGRKPIETHLARIGNEEKVYDFLKGELSSGRQVYFVYPLIEQSDKINLKDAESMFAHLKEVFPDYRLGLIHSRLDDGIKKETMDQFSLGEVDILVATSVVEVGVDVPNATVIVIEQAERFGLSALHQLRGRVGRGEHQSYCFLVYSNLLTEEGKQRLMTMKENTDGFIIAEEDLKLRGPGDIVGVKQSGFLKLSIADLTRDLKVLMMAREDAFELLKKDPGFLEPDHEMLRELYSEHPPFNDALMSFG